MENTKNLKALYIIVNAGFAEEVMDVVRSAGAGGATIVNARGTGAMQKAFLGISIDTEKEIVISLVEAEVAERIMAAVNEQAGLHSQANGICFSLPVDKAVTVNKQDLQEFRQKAKRAKEKHKHEQQP